MCYANLSESRVFASGRTLGRKYSILARLTMNKYAETIGVLHKYTVRRWVMRETYVTL